MEPELFPKGNEKYPEYKHCSVIIAPLYAVDRVRQYLNARGLPVTVRDQPYMWDVCNPPEEVRCITLDNKDDFDAVKLAIDEFNEAQ